MKHYLIDIIAFTTILSNILVITSKNPVISVIFLISLFINAACYLILIGVGFIGISYIIVYIGAIAVLFLFVIMMINIKTTDISLILDTFYNFNGLILNSELINTNNVYVVFSPIIPDTNFVILSQIETIGQVLYTSGAF